LTINTTYVTYAKNVLRQKNHVDFHNRMFPATESFGIMAIQQAPLCNIKYNNGPNVITYFSM